MTLASQALNNSLPAGNAVAAVYGFRWFRRFGADDTLAVWAMTGTLVASMASLSLIAAAGLALATDEGASLDLIPVLIGILLVTMAVGSTLRLRASAPIGSSAGSCADYPAGSCDDRRGTPPHRSIGSCDGSPRSSWVGEGRHHRRMGHGELALRLRLFRHDVPGHRFLHPLERSPARLRSRPARRGAADHARRTGCSRGEHHHRPRRIRWSACGHGRRRAALPAHQLLAGPDHRLAAVG